MAKSVHIGSVDQIPPGEGRNFIVEQEQIAVFRTHAGEVYATQATCPHRNGPLADGLLGGATIVCPLHDRTFDLRTQFYMAIGDDTPHEVASEYKEVGECPHR